MSFDGRQRERERAELGHTCCCVLELLQMLVNDAMQSNANLGHETLEIIAVKAPLNLLNDWDDLLNNVLACGRCERIEIAFRLEISLSLFTLQIDFDPTDQ